MKAADIFVRALENEGVEYLFGLPGEENLRFLNSIKNSKQIKFILTRHEQSAGFMAATLGRLTGKPGVCLSTLGPGAMNLVTAAGYAKLGGMPMIMITGQKPIKIGKQGQFQIIDAVELMRGITKFTKSIVDGNNVSFLVREAFRVATEERPGPVHIELPEDIANEEVSNGDYIHTPSYVRRPIPDEKAVNKAVELIQKAKHPLLLIGSGANRKLTSKILTELINKFGFYFITTQMGKGVIDERNPCYLGCAALSQGDFLHCAIKKADLIINVGHDIIEKPPFFMEQDENKKVIHINYFTASVDRVYFPQIEIIGDIANSIWQIMEKIKAHFNWDFSYFKSLKEKLDQDLNKKADIDKFPMIPQFIVKEIRDVMPEDGIICLDNGLYKIWFARNYKAYFQNTVLLDNALATMGAGLPSAIAAKIICPEKKILAVCGDGGFMMNSQEIETALRLNLDITCLILRDDRYGMILWKQKAMELPHFGLDFGNPDFVKYARSYGAKGFRVENPKEFKPLLKKCLFSKGINIIDVPIDYISHDEIFPKNIEDNICSI